MPYETLPLVAVEMQRLAQVKDRRQGDFLHFLSTVFTLHYDPDLERKAMRIKRAKYQLLFTTFDLDGDGFLTVTELTTMMDWSVHCELAAKMAPQKWSGHAAFNLTRLNYAPWTGMYTKTAAQRLARTWCSASLAE